MKDRLNRLHKAMCEKELDAVLLSSITAIRYFSGFTSDEAIVVVTRSRNVLITDFRYTIQAQEQAGSSFEIVEASYDKQLDQLRKVLADDSAASVGFEEDLVSYAAYTRFKDLKIRLVPFADELHRLRLIKTPEEIACLQRAQDLADRSFRELLTVVHAGMTEKRVAAELTYIAAKLGSEGPSFDTIVGSGPNGAMCHAIPGDRALQNGDLVVLDFGCLFNGYHSDMTRTFAVGPVDDFSVEIYNIVREAQERALRALRPGITGKQLDSVARDYISKCGYGECFGHSLGHGFGLLIHEAPRASQTSDTVFEEGMTITVEPGIYIEGRLGVRIEDCCVLTKDGMLNLCSSPKELLRID